MIKKLPVIIGITAMLAGCNTALFGANVNPIVASQEDIEKFEMEDAIVFLVVTGEGRTFLVKNPDPRVVALSKDDMIKKVKNLEGLETATITVVTYPGSHCVWAGGFERCYPPH